MEEEEVNWQLRKLWTHALQKGLVEEEAQCWHGDAAIGSRYSTTTGAVGTVAGAVLPAGVGVQPMAAGAAALLQAQHQFLLSLTLHLCSALNP